MKIEPRRFASLSSGLLARKGAARPAMRPQAFGQIGAAPEDLGWNDMGYDPPRPSLTPLRDEQHDAFGEELPAPTLRNPLAALTPASPVHGQQAELAERLAGEQNDAGDDYGDEVDETAELYEPGETSVPAVADSALEAVTEQPREEPAVATVVPLVQPTPSAPAPRREKAPRTTAKAAFTLRIDADRHLRLRLASAVTGRSAQQLLTAALDELIDSMPKLDQLARQAPAASKRANRKG